MTVTKQALPDDALLQRYAQRGDCYTDCYVAPAEAPLPAFISAFYTTPLFRAERLILRLAGHPSTDADVAALAAGAARFAAWTVEDRVTDQILLCDASGRTRSWLMARQGQVHFGSAVTPGQSGDGLGVLFRLLLPFHKLYARALLRAAVRRLRLLPPE